MNRTLAFSACIVAALTASACASSQTDPLTGERQADKTRSGALIGAGVGALVGVLARTGDDASKRRKSALIGAGVGALVGGGIGSYMDQQEEELRAQLRGAGVSVTRHGERIILNLPENVAFGTDQDHVSPRFYGALNSVAIVLRRYDRTSLEIDGHTDDTGSRAYNQALSERRALAVSQYLNAQGVAAQRLFVSGFGEDQPIASNATAAGRASNRRVEIRISPLA